MGGQTVDIIEVAPRDGLQNEASMVSTDDKVELIRRAADAGARRIEAVSFVHPRVVPQMADAEAVMAAVPRTPGVRLAGLVLNSRGLERAVGTGVDEINYVVVASDTFSVKNQGCRTAEGVQTWSAMSATAVDAGVFRTVTIAAAFGCPFEGEVPRDRVVDIARRVAQTGVDELCLADTIGVADPVAVGEVLDGVRRACPDVALRVHLHNTRNTGIANAYAAVQAGVHALDASLAGIGGCPFAPAATGNIPTEDIVYMLDRMGVSSGIDLAALVSSVGFVEKLVDHPTPGMLAKAGMFPPPVLETST